MQYQMKLDIEGFEFNIDCAPDDDGYAYAICGEGLVSGMDGFDTIYEATKSAYGEAIKHVVSLHKVADTASAEADSDESEATE